MIGRFEASRTTPDTSAEGVSGRFDRVMVVVDSMIV